MKAIIELDDKKFKKLKRSLEIDADRDLSDIEALKELFFIEDSKFRMIDYREYAKIEMIKE
jgi:predicted transcriptional regulator